MVGASLGNRHVLATFILILQTFSFACRAEAFAVLTNQSQLFSSYDEIEARLEAPFDSLFKARLSENPKAITIYGNLIIGRRAIPVELRMRGFSTLKICDFPKLMIKAKKNQALGTILQGNEKIDLGTHCSDSEPKSTLAESMSFNHRESLIYRWLNLLGIPTLSSRPAVITYIDTSTPERKSLQRRAFFVEHWTRFLDRIGGIEVRGINDHPEAAGEDAATQILYKYEKLELHTEVNRFHLAKVAMIQSLIGNADWRFESGSLWNMRLVQLRDGSWIPVPFDFNLADLVKGNSNSVYSIRDSYFTTFSQNEQLEFINSVLSKKSELKVTLNSLAGDPRAQAFTGALELLLAELELQRATLGSHILTAEQDSAKD